MMTSIAKQLLALGTKHMTSDSRLVREESVFVAYVGERNDGRAYISQAIAQGAKVVVYEADDFVWDDKWQVPHFPVSGLRAQVSSLAAAFYGNPSNQLWVVGVTGTNGKTSCTQWIAKAFSMAGKKSAVIGTLGNGFVDALAPTHNTTPDPILLQAMLADYVKQGAQAVAMEVSSHGLAQGRVSGVAFDVAVFTNLTHDHLDYHGTIEAYAAAKRQLFDWPNLQHAILNVDDNYGKQWAAELQAAGKPVMTYGFAKADVQAEALVLNNAGLSMQVHTLTGDAKIEAALYGKFNASNLLAVLSTLLASDVALPKAVACISVLKSVAGRMQSLGGGAQPVVIVDYAHTPDALEKVLLTLREQTQGQLICVFGCGGNRDAAKRGPMGEIASRIADQVIVTTDNPRNESAATIAAQIVQGAQRACRIELDRSKAILSAIQAAKPADIVLVAGKGHEDYQEVAGVKLPFSDVEVVTQALESYEVAA